MDVKEMYTNEQKEQGRMNTTTAKKVNHAARKYGVCARIHFTGGKVKTFWWDGYRWWTGEADAFLYTKGVAEKTLAFAMESKPLARGDAWDYEVVRLVK